MLFRGERILPEKKLEKRTLFAFQTEEASESLRYPESEKSTSEESARQLKGRTELSDKRTESVISDNTTEQSMAKDCIETVDVDDDERTSDWDYTTSWRSQRLTSYLKSSARLKDDRQRYCWTQGVHTYFRPVLQNGTEFQEFK